MLLVYVIHFDSGPDECNVLHRGPLEECEKVRDLVPALVYKGDRKPLSAETVIVDDTAIVLERP